MTSYCAELDVAHLALPSEGLGQGSWFEENKMYQYGAGSGAEFFSVKDSAVTGTSSGNALKAKFHCVPDSVVTPSQSTSFKSPPSLQDNALMSCESTRYCSHCYHQDRPLASHTPEALCMQLDQTRALDMINGWAKTQMVCSQESFSFQ